MFDHGEFGVSDHAASSAFFLKALEPLGITAGAEDWPTYGVALCSKSDSSLCLFQTEKKPAPLHRVLTAGNRQHVDTFYSAALTALAAPGKYCLGNVPASCARAHVSVALRLSWRKTPNKSLSHSTDKSAMATQAADCATFERPQVSLTVTWRTDRGSAGMPR